MIKYNRLNMERLADHVVEKMTIDRLMDIAYEHIMNAYEQDEEVFFIDVDLLEENAAQELFEDEVEEEEEEEEETEEG